MVAYVQNLPLQMNDDNYNYKCQQIQYFSRQLMSTVSNTSIDQITLVELIELLFCLGGI